MSRILKGPKGRRVLYYMVVLKWQDSRRVLYDMVQDVMCYMVQYVMRVEKIVSRRISAASSRAAPIREGIPGTSWPRLGQRIPDSIGSRCRNCKRKYMCTYVYIYICKLYIYIYIYISHFLSLSLAVVVCALPMGQN